VSANAYCPADHPYILSGGYAAAGGILSGNDTIYGSLPTSQGQVGGWTIALRQQVAQPELVKVWTICAK
jgi:hypothetical protein